MAKIGNVILPGPVNQYMVTLLEGLPSEWLEQAGRELLPGGFSRLDAIKRRCATMIQSDATLPRWLEEMLLDSLLSRMMVSLLSETALKLGLQWFATLAGREDLILALLLDPRKAVQDLGTELLRVPESSPTVPSVDIARHEVSHLLDEALGPPLGVVITPEEDDLAEPGEDVTAAAGATRDSIEEEVGRQGAGVEAGLSRLAEIERLLAASEAAPPPPGSLADWQAKLDKVEGYLHDEKKRGKEKLKEQEDRHRAELLKAQAERKALADRLALAERERNNLQDQLQKAGQTQQAAIRKGVEEETSILLRKWLEAPIQTEATVTRMESAIPNLLERAERTLEQQAQHDRHAGNRLKLRQHLDRLREFQRRAKDALQHAIHPITPLRRVASELDQEIHRIEELLGETSTGSVTEELLARINQASSMADLQPVSGLIHSLEEHRLISSLDQRRIYDSLHRKFSRLEEAGQMKDAERDLDQSWSLRRLLVHNRSAKILVDGHNVLFSLADLYGGHLEQDHPGRESRERLLQSLVKLVANRGHVEVMVVFDGPVRKLESIAPNVRVEYSGGTGEHRADQRIVLELEGKDLASVDRKTFVVTNDREVRRDVLRRGARYVPVEAFAVLLTDFRCL